MRNPEAPKHLSTEARTDWGKFHQRFDLDDDCREILTELLEASDRKREARKEIERDGCTIKDRFGQLRQHPACAIERDSRLAILRCLKMLGLPLAEEKEPKRKTGRKPGT